MQHGDIVEAIEANIFGARNKVGDKFTLVLPMLHPLGTCWYVTASYITSSNHRIWDDRIGEFVYCYIFPEYKIKLLKPKRKEELLDD